MRLILITNGICAAEITELRALNQGISFVYKNKKHFVKIEQALGTYIRLDSGGIMTLINEYARCNNCITR